MQYSTRWLPYALISILLLQSVQSKAAESDAERLLAQARTSYAAGNYDDARAAAQKSAETDPQNADLHLLLGKIHFALGDTDSAVTEWKKTLEIAPQESFSAKMLELLQGRKKDVNARIAFLRALVADRLYDTAGAECRGLLQEKSLAATQRAAVLMLQAELELRNNQLTSSLHSLDLVKTLHAGEVDPLELKLLVGSVKSRMSGDTAVQGLALLTEVASSNQPKLADRAALEIILFQIDQQGIATASTAQLKLWITAHGDASTADIAREKLFASMLTLFQQQPDPNPQATLTTVDNSMLEAAQELLKHRPRSDEAGPIVTRALAGIETRYASHDAHSAAAAAIGKLLDVPLPRVSKVAVQLQLASYLSKVAVKRIDELARLGQLASADPSNLLPELQKARAAYDTAESNESGGPAALALALLAEEVRAYSSQIAWPEKIVRLRPTDAWAITLALPVLEKSNQAKARQTAVILLQTVEKEYMQTGRPEARTVALEIDGRLYAVAKPNQSMWTEIVANRLTLLDTVSQLDAQENIEHGHGDDNAKLSASQNLLLAVLADWAQIDVRRSDFVIQRLAGHLKPWAERDQWTVVSAAYARFAQSLPEDQRWQAELGMARAIAQRVFERDGRTAHVGLIVPRELDPLAKQAIVICYDLQAGLKPTSPQLTAIRNAWQSFVVHYRNLEYDDVALAALQVKGKQPVPEAEEFAAFETIRFNDHLARREFERALLLYGAKDKIVLTPALQATLADWTKWIIDKPTGPFTPQAVNQLLAIGALFEQHEAYDTAAGIYGNFSAKAKTVKSLDLSTNSKIGVAQRAGLLAAAALERQAAAALTKTLAERKPDDPLPTKPSAEYAAAISAETSLLASYPDNLASRDSLRKITSAALAYAKIDAWDAAENIFADLQASAIKIRSPERLEFARGICKMGQAMPDHARAVLEQLVAAGQGRNDDGAGASETALALSMALPTNGDILGSAMGSKLQIAQSLASVRKDVRDTRLDVGADDPSIESNIRASSGPASASRPQNSEPSKTPSENVAAGDRANDAQANADPFSDGLTVTTPAPQTAQAKHDADLVAMVSQQERNRSSRIANLQSPQFSYMQTQNGTQADSKKQQALYQPLTLAPAELTRLDKAIAGAYEIFKSVSQNYAETPTAAQARYESLAMIGFWRVQTEWDRAAQLGERFLIDNKSDSQLPQLRLAVARDRLAWASKLIAKPLTRQEMMAEISRRFTAAQADLNKIVAEFHADRTLQQEAQWDIAQSYLTEARTISALSPTLARGQFVRAARELRGVAVKYPDHPRIGEIPQILWGIAIEMERQGYDDEAVLICNELAISDPLNSLAQQAIEKIATSYRRDLKRPLKAAETYLELNFVRGGNDLASQNAVFEIGSTLKKESRWVEALHVLETFVDSFPKHAQAGQALVVIGEIHQTNLAWDDAIAAYRRVIDEYKESQWVQTAKWSIAECKINLIQWPDATAAYRDYVTTYPQDAKVAEANRRIDILKDLARFQELVNEKGQRKAFDAQFQIATIVRTQLANPIKGIIEYRKVVTNWPDSYVAASALHEIGKSYLGLGETAKAREAFNAVAHDYPTSPLAGASLFLVGKSYEDEADQLATVTRERTLEKAKDMAQKNAYAVVQSNRKNQEMMRSGKIRSLKGSGDNKAAELEEANGAFSQQTYNYTNTAVLTAQQAQADCETFTASQLADRQDKIHAALRKAIEAYAMAAKIPGGNKADSALLQMANIYDQRLKDSKAAMETWLEIVRQFSGTAVAQDASWKLAQYYEREGKFAQAIESYNAFLRNYRTSGNAGAAQFAVAECYEHLGQWVAAMDSYNNYINNFPENPQVAKAKEQISWIKTYRL